MTSERKLLIEVRDIVGIEFECPKCGVRVGYKMAEQFVRIVQKCPNCNEEFFLPVGLEGIQELIAQLKRDFRSRARIRLQLSDSICAESGAETKENGHVREV
jgi:hypothetical protein